MKNEYLHHWLHYLVIFVTCFVSKLTDPEKYLVKIYKYMLYNTYLYHNKLEIVVEAYRKPVTSAHATCDGAEGCSYRCLNS